MTTLETKDIQGLIISGYPQLDASSYHFLALNETAGVKSWLADIATMVATADWGPARERKPMNRALNIAFTVSGLKKLGLPDDACHTLPQELREGMFESNRARRLGDNGRSDPARWEFGKSTDGIDALLILQAKNDVERATFYAEVRANLLAAGVGEVVKPQVSVSLQAEKEHFGFHDGISQPEIEGSPRSAARGAASIQPGEFILGYENEYGRLPPTPIVSSKLDVKNHLQLVAGGSGCQKDLGRNGSFLVFRKLYQDVAGFNRYVAENSMSVAERELIAAKLVGRWPNGAPLAIRPTTKDRDSAPSKPENDFGYASIDPHGYSCPIGSHIRRTNPRDSLGNDPQESLRTVRRHRLIRRGTPYGPALATGATGDDGEDRGLFFVCINADIQRQFEFVQQTWANNPKFGGLYDDRDPLIGDNQEPGESGPPSQMTIQCEPIRRRLFDLPRFVVVRGGGYFFLPSISALRFIAALPRPVA